MLHKNSDKTFWSSDAKINDTDVLNFLIYPALVWPVKLLGENIRTCNTHKYVF